MSLEHQYLRVPRWSVSSATQSRWLCQRCVYISTPTRIERRRKISACSRVKGVTFWLSVWFRNRQVTWTILNSYTILIFLYYVSRYLRPQKIVLLCNVNSNIKQNYFRFWLETTLIMEIEDFFLLSIFDFTDIVIIWN